MPAKEDKGDPVLVIPFIIGDNSSIVHKMHV